MNITHTRDYDKSIKKLSKIEVSKILKLENLISSKDNLDCVNYKKLQAKTENLVSIRVDFSIRLIAELKGENITFHYVGSHDKIIRWLNNQTFEAAHNEYYGKFDSVNEVKRYVIKDKSINNNEIYDVGIIPHGDYFYKYMDLESALLSLKNNHGESTLRFVEPTSWDDEYEGRFYNANYSNVDDGTNSPFLYACCMTTKSENEAAWLVYSHNRKGLASRCVEFKLNRKTLREQIMKSNSANGCKVYVGSVSYLNSYSIDHIHEPKLDQEDNHYYHEFFDDFSLINYISLLLLKRLAYQHEEEIRIFIIPGKKEEKYQGKKLCKEGEKAKQLFVELDWIDIIEKVSIDNDCSEYEKELLQNLIYELLDKKKGTYSPDAYQAKREKLKIKPFDVYEDNRDAQITIGAREN